MRTGYSSDLVLHAFARTARASAIGEELTQPFFDSMRADLGSADAAPGGLVYDAAAHEKYVYGSAEVVGLMCLQVFLRESSPSDEELAVLRRGACRLGAAFQNVNFLRDLADDTDRLGRSYLGETGRLTDDDRDAWVQTVREVAIDNSAFELSCTPGYYNNEGRGGAVGNGSFLGDFYSPGFYAFDDLLAAWRDSGELEGLELSK
jgi:hypothetical protein